MIFTTPALIIAVLLLIDYANAWNRVMMNARRSAFCLERNGNYYTIAAKTCTNVVAQQWYFDLLNRLINNNGECLFEISGLGNANTVVYTGLCDTANHFKWLWNDNGQLTVQSSKAGSPMCLDIQGGSDFDNSAIIITPCSSSSQSQTWARGFNCLPGQSFNTAKDGCTACTTGTFKSSMGNSACQSCPLNSQCPTVTDFTCNMGYTVNTARNGCSSCLLGQQYKPDNGNQSCTACPAGAVCPTISSFVCAPGYGISGASCVQCSGATPYKNTFGNTACQACPPNTQCDGTSFTCLAGFTLNAAKTGCDRCSDITYKTFTGNDTCLACPTGGNCTASNSFSCKVGYELTPAKTECKLCDVKYFKTSFDNSSCSLCAVGSEYVADRTACTTCKDQWYRPSQVFEKCIGCPGNATCSTMTFACLGGYQVNAAGTGCYKCPANSFKADPGNVQCTVCAIGTQANAAGTACVSCPTGYYRPSLGMSSCQQCPTGASCTVSTLTCQAGWRLNDNNLGCIQCPLGREPITIESAQECAVCRANMQRSSLSMGSCAPCPSNAACPSASTFICNTGYSKSQNQSSCVYTGCPTGYYKLLQDDNCYVCPDHSACYANSFLCTAGYSYSAQTKSCVKCSEGLFKSAEGNYNCTSCPNIGTQPSADNTKCETCPTGKFRPDLQSPTCVSCPQNAKCTPTLMTCKAGYIKDAQNALACAKCPSGTIRPLETDSACVACGAGQYASDDGTFCLNCPVGTFKLSTGECMQCSVGSQPNDLRTSCVRCPTGTYRPTNATATCITCPDGASCTAANFTCLSGFTKNFAATGCIVKTQEMNQAADSTGPAVGGTFAVIFILMTVVYLYVKGPPEFLKGKDTNMTSSTTNLNNGSSYNLTGTKAAVANSYGTLSKPMMSGANNNTSKSKVAPEWSNATFSLGSATTSQRDNVAITDQTSLKSLTLVKYASTQKLQSEMAGINELDNIIAGIEEKLPTKIQFEIGIDFRSQKFISQDGIYKAFAGTGLHRDLIKFGEMILIKEVAEQSDPDSIDSMQREIRTLYKMQECKFVARLLGYSKNPNLIILKNYHIGSLELWIASRKFIKRKAIVLSFVENITEAVAFVHRKGYSHCSLKPSNIMLELDEEAGGFYCVVTGFSDSQAISQPYKIPKSFQLNYSTRAYLAPEIQRQLKPGTTSIRIDTSKSDIYAMGIIFYQLITRQLPWSR